MIVGAFIFVLIARVLNDGVHSQTEVRSKQMNNDRSSTVPDGYEIDENVFVDGEEDALEEYDD